MFGIKSQKIFATLFHVKPLENSIMPSGLAGAYVECYTTGRDYEEAAKKCFQKLMTDGFDVVEILSPILEVKPEKWAEEYEKAAAVAGKDAANHLPSQREFNQLMKQGKVVYGTFASYE